MECPIIKRKARLSGICFQIPNAPKDTDVIEEFAYTIWSNGAFTFDVSQMTPATWRDFEGVILDGYAIAQSVSFFMHNLDQANEEQQHKLAEIMEIEGSKTWLVSVHDYRKLIPELLGQLCVYLGTDEQNRMQFLAQDEHSIIMER
jgi:hypothetical protein